MATPIPKSATRDELIALLQAMPSNDEILFIFEASVLVAIPPKNGLEQCVNYRGDTAIAVHLCRKYRPFK